MSTKQHMYVQMAVIHIYRYIFIPLSLHSPNNINRILSATESKQQGDRCELIIFVDFKVVKIPATEDILLLLQAQHGLIDPTCYSWWKRGFTDMMKLHSCRVNPTTNIWPMVNKRRKKKYNKSKAIR